MAETTDPRTLQPGTRMRHVLGGSVVLKERKADDSGWWNTDGSGLWDEALKEGTWRVLTPETDEVIVRRDDLDWLVSRASQQWQGVRMERLRAALGLGD